MAPRDLRVTRVELENIRCFAQIALDLAPAGAPVSLAVILGDNGVGKSTLLKSITLGLSSPKAASALFEAPGAPWLRRGTTQGSIHLTFNTGEFAHLCIGQESWGERIASHECTAVDLLHEQVLVCGYGAARRAFGDKSMTEYSLREAVWSLFHYDARLQNPELILRRLADTADPTAAEVLQWIDHVLLLPPGSTRLGQTGLEVSGPWGDFTPGGALGDGYQATMAWLFDLLGWVMYRNHLMLREGVRGIVLVDEIEQHLHPSWQRRIYYLLAQQFPQVQFLTTTHAPLCVIGTTDLDDQQVSLVHLRQSEQTVEAVSGITPPRGMRADQVLTSFLFGMETSGDDQTKREIERLSALLAEAQRSPEEEAEVAQLRQHLNAKLGSGETALEQWVDTMTDQVMEEYYRQLLQRATGSSRQESIHAQAVDLEVRRQFKELFSKL